MSETGRTESMAGGDRNLRDPCGYPVPAFGLVKVLHPAAACALVDKTVLVPVDVVVRGLGHTFLRIVIFLDPHGVGDKKAPRAAERIHDLRQQPKDSVARALVLIGPDVAGSKALAVRGLVEFPDSRWYGIEDRRAQAPSRRDRRLAGIVLREAKPGRVEIGKTEVRPNTIDRPRVSAQVIDAVMTQEALEFRVQFLHAIGGSGDLRERAVMPSPLRQMASGIATKPQELKAPGSIYFPISR